MQKGAGHFHLGERDKQLECYKKILRLEALPKITRARTYANLAVVYIHFKQHFVAAGHLQKAEELASIQEIEKIIGSQAYHLFATTYCQIADALYLSHPEQSLIYLRKSLQVPEQPEGYYVEGHLNLAVCYDRLLMSRDSLSHALEVLRFQALSSQDRNRALCYASLGYEGIDEYDESIRYFERISDVEKLHKNERHLLLCTLGKIYLKKEDHKKGIELKHQGIDALDPTEAAYLVQKYDLAKAYGQIKNEEKEIEIYGEILEGIRTISFDQEWKERMKSIQMSIETTFFLKELDEKLDEAERHFQEQLDHRKREREAQKAQEKETSKEKEKFRQKKLSQRAIDEIKQAQKEAVEREKKLDEEKRKKIEEQKVRDENRKSYPMEKPGSFFVEQSFSQSTRYVPEPKASKVKTRGEAAAAPSEEEGEEKEQSSEVLSPTFPQLGTRAQKVFHQIEDEDWDFTREEYSCLLADLQCERRETASSHRVFQLPKTTILTLERNGEEIQEYIFWADEDIELGSVTLPGWREKVPLYLRKQLRHFHHKIIEMYTKVTVMRQFLSAESGAL